jgi:hypothetical protein
MPNAQPRRAGLVLLVLAALVLLAAALVVAGCGKSDKYVGTWKTQNGGVITVTKAGETWSLQGDKISDAVKFVTMADLKEDGDTLKSSMGTVKVDGDTMTLTVQPSNTGGSEVITAERQ